MIYAIAMTSDRRKAHRFTPPGGAPQVLLQVGDAALPGQLLDESATGLAIMVDMHPGVYEGETVWLTVGGSVNRVRVTRISREACGVRIGLQRIVDTAQPSPLPARRFHLWRMPSSPRVQVIIGLAAALTVGSVLLMHQARPQVVEANQDGSAEEEPAANDAYEALRQLGPAVFLEKKVARVLALSTGDLARLRQLAASHAKALELAKDTGSSAEELRRMRRDAQDEACRSLSPTQQAKWEEILEQSRQINDLLPSTPK